MNFRLVSIPWKRSIEAVFLNATMEFFDDSNVNSV